MDNECKLAHIYIVNISNLQEDTLINNKNNINNNNNNMMCNEYY